MTGNNNNNVIATHDHLTILN